MENTNQTLHCVMRILLIAIEKWTRNSTQSRIIAIVRKSAGMNLQRKSYTQKQVGVECCIVFVWKHNLWSVFQCVGNKMAFSCFEKNETLQTVEPFFTLKLKLSLYNNPSVGTYSQNVVFAANKFLRETSDKVFL